MTAPGVWIGSHLSIAGSMCHALREGEELGLDTVQVFTKNQQQWKVKALDPGMVREWRGEVARLGWEGRTVSHASYLINLASVDGELWGKSVDLMTVELERCEELGIPFLVHHPGSHVGTTLEAGLARIVDAYGEVFARTRGFRVVSCLEGTVGAGSTIGGPHEHLAALRERIVGRTGEPARVGFCLDTCHMHAFGHDLSTRESARAVLDEFDRVAGLAHVRVLHLNDSKGACASRLDRHEHIGRGTIGGRRLGESGFAEFMDRRELRGKPMILETPKERETVRGKEVACDLGNARRLRSLVASGAGDGRAAGARKRGTGR